MKVRLIKDYKEHRKGEIVDLASSEARRLVSSGVARVDRMFTDYVQALKDRADRITKRKF